MYLYQFSCFLLIEKLSFIPPFLHTVYVKHTVKWRHFRQDASSNLALGNCLVEVTACTSMNKPAMKSVSRLLSGFTAENYRHRCSFTGLLQRGVRGPLNQLLCGSVNRVNVTHFVKNYTATTVSFGPIWSR